MKKSQTGEEVRKRLLTCQVDNFFGGGYGDHTGFWVLGS